MDSEDVVLLPHINADGDALGAALALGLALSDMGKNVDTSGGGGSIQSGFSSRTGVNKDNP